jgi:hypothetical protein
MKKFPTSEMTEMTSKHQNVNTSHNFDIQTLFGGQNG